MSAADVSDTLDPVAAGAEIGAALWRARRCAETTGDALAWVRGSRAVLLSADADAETVEPGALFSALLPSDGAGSPLAGVLAATARDLRMALVCLDSDRSGYEPEPGDVFETIRHAERRVSIALRAVHLESDAALLAMHAAARGAVPDAETAPSDFRDHPSPPPAATLATVAQAIGAAPGDLSASLSVARVWGLGIGVERAERLLLGLAHLRAELAATPGTPGGET